MKPKLKKDGTPDNRFKKRAKSKKSFATKRKSTSSKNQKNPANGQFLPGNQYWKLRTTDGRDYEYTDVKEFAEKCAEYIDYIQANPLYESRVVSGEIYELPKMRAMSIEGLCNHLDITVKTYRSYRDRSDFLPVLTRVEQIMYAQKFEGAAAELLSHSIISRDLGLVDKKEVAGLQPIVIEAANDGEAKANEEAIKNLK